LVLFSSNISSKLYSYFCPDNVISIVFPFNANRSEYSFILSARLEFERQYKAGGGEGQFGQEMSPLLCFGYRVGKPNGRIERERHSILKYAMAADLNAMLPFLPASYRADWGDPLTIARFSRVYQHINNMADLREGRRNFEVAVSHWRADAAWLRTQQLPLVQKFSAI
jgi:hypothetical protein